MGIPIHIDMGTIKDSLQKTLAEANANVKNSPDLRQALLLSQKHDTEMAAFISKVMQLILYVCAKNAEVTANSEQAFCTKRGSVIKDRYAEIRKWDVGVRIGAGLKKQYHRTGGADTEPQGTHASPRPHLRRGHWHHFWVGSKSKEENRSLILKWVPPMMVAANQDESPVVLNFIKTDE